MDFHPTGEGRSPMEALRDEVARVMEIHAVTVGGPEHGFAVKFRGRLVGDSGEAYQRLQPVFARWGYTPLFRWEGPDHAVIAAPGVPKPRASNPLINLLLFVLTLGSVASVGLASAAAWNHSLGLGSLEIQLARDLNLALVYAGSLLAILLFHEFGHYIAARFHRVAVTLPYFIPFPFTLFGTLGAFIQLKSPPRSRRALLDIGLAGPLAGLLVAVPILFLGLSLSQVGPLEPPAQRGLVLYLEGNSLFYLAAKYLVTGQLLPAPADYGGLHPALYWLRYLFLGEPAPFGGTDISLHPMAWAGWAGLLVTALNLIPAGQLDGGHVMYVLLGRRASRLWPFLVVAMVAMGFIWQGWWLWAVLIYFLGQTYAQPLDEITPLDGRRRLLAYFGLVVFVLVFTPVPLKVFGA
jgi:membrane-associated protease RseP (regulator of RpoE activity)